MSGLNVLIVGSSIAGPSAAYWFAKAGAKVTVIERYPELRTTGQGIDIRSVGVSVMRKIPDFEAAVRAKSPQMEAMSFVREDGRPYGAIRPSGNPDEQALLSEYEIYRGHLSQILVHLTKDNENVKYVFGEQVASMQQNENGDTPVTVTFANGLPTSDFDLVVACDGATSRTRAIGFDCSSRDYVKLTNCWAAYFTIKEDLLNGGNTAQGFSAVGGRFITLHPDPSRVTRVLLMSVYPRNDPDATLPFLEASKQGDQALKDFVAQRYRGGGWRIDEVMDRMMDADDFYANGMVQVKFPRLYRGRFVLVGDAGYAAGPTGCGTSLAMAGGYVLAGEICKHKGNLAAGLQGYEKVMRPIVDDLQKIPPFVPDLVAPQTAWGIWLRNWIFAFVTCTRILDFAQKFFGAGFANADRHKLPDYEWAN